MPPARKSTPLPAVVATLASADEAFLPVNQRVYRALRRAIINCTLAPGTPLSETDVSDLFEVSRQPVREAFIKLVEAGLVRVLPQRGTYVMKISARQVQDARFIREAIESAIVREAAAGLSQTDLDRLASNLEQQLAACERADMVQFLALDDAFHAQLASSIDRRSAWEQIENLKAHMDRVRYLTLDHISPMRQLQAQHQQLYNALAAHDVIAAVAAIQTHLTQLTHTLGLVAERYPDWFD